MTFHFNEDHEKTIKRMASSGMRLSTIAKALGCAERTITRNNEMQLIYRKALAEALDKVGRVAMEKAMDGSETMLKLVLNTQAEWSEAKHVEHQFSGSFDDKIKQLDELLADGMLSIKDYKDLAQSFTEQYKVYEYENRLKAVEYKIGISE